MSNVGSDEETPASVNNPLDELLAFLAEQEATERASENPASSAGTPRPEAPVGAPSCFGDPIQLLAQTLEEDEACGSCAVRRGCMACAGGYVAAQQKKLCLGRTWFHGRLPDCPKCSLSQVCADVVKVRAMLRPHSIASTEGATGHRKGGIALKSDRPLDAGEEAAKRELDAALADLYSPMLKSVESDVVPPAAVGTGARPLPSAASPTGAGSASPPADTPIDDRPTAGVKATGVTTRTTLPGDGYSFPSGPDFDSASDRVRAHPTETLLEELRVLTDFGHQTSADIYVTRRSEFCAISRVLNERRHIPPSLRSRFRPRPPTKEKLYSSNERALANDLRVLDLDWLHRTGRLRMSSLVDTNGALDLARAAAWASTKKDGSDRAADLQIAESIARELSICRSKVIADQQSRDQKALHGVTCPGNFAHSVT